MKARKAIVGFGMSVIIMGILRGESVAEEVYPVNQTDRPLLLPTGTWEVAIGSAFLDGNEREDVQPVLNLRYAVDDDIELTLLGLRYRFVDSPGQQWVAEIQNFGINTDFNHHTLIGVHGKQFLHADWSIQYRLGAYFADSHEKDGNTHEWRSTLGVQYQFARRGAVEVTYAYRDLSGFNQTSANLFKLALHYTIWSDLDVELGYADSNFHEAVDSVLFNESYRHRYDLVLRWRVGPR